MVYLTKTDLKGSISANTLTTLQGTADANLNECESLAISEIAPLRDLYNIDVELGKTDASRNIELKRMLVAFTVYYLFNTVEDDSIPQRVKDNYDKELKTVLAIANGKQSSTMQRNTNADGEETTNFSYNTTQKLRSLDPYHR